jgi:hypothetical protein
MRFVVTGVSPISAQGCRACICTLQQRISPPVKGGSDLAFHECWPTAAGRAWTGPGTGPADVVEIRAGTVGDKAARVGSGMGAHVLDVKSISCANSTPSSVKTGGGPTQGGRWTFHHGGLHNARILVAMLTLATMKGPPICRVLMVALGWHAQVARSLYSVAEEMIGNGSPHVPTPARESPDQGCASSGST